MSGALEPAVQAAYNSLVSAGEIPREELTSALEARRELGPELEPHLVDGFLERVGTAIDRRVDARLEERTERQAPGPIHLGLPLGSIALGIPVTGAAGSTVGLAGVIVAWIAIALINVAYALRR